MITAERKPLAEVIDYINDCRRILLVGCNECVTVCAAGGRKEVATLASAMQMDFMKRGRTVEIREMTLERQCEPEYVEQLAPFIDQVDAVVSMACGCGVQEVVRRYRAKRVYPAVNTQFMGATERPGVWVERCHGCGNCLLGLTGGICPIARCSKRLMNGPCGGSSKGKCEVTTEIDCVWQLIWDRLKELGIEDRYEEIILAKDWRTERGGGPRKIVREDLAQ
jgi:ferredoxin